MTRGNRLLRLGVIAPRKAGLVAVGAGFALLMALLAGQGFALPPGKTCVNSAGMRFVRVEAGNFLIVQPPVHDPDAELQHDSFKLRAVDAQSG
jgi:hypothetical protein